MFHHPDDRVALAQDAFAHLVHDAQTSVHQEHVFKLIFCLDGTLGMEADVVVDNVQAMMVAPGFKHRMWCRGQVLALFFSAQDPLVRAMVAHMRRPWTVLAPQKAIRLMHMARGHVGHFQADAVTGLMDEARHIVGFHDLAPQRLDHRLLRVQAHILSQTHRQIPVAELARVAAVSAPHLMRLFRQQVGTSLRAYGLWQRLLCAMAWMVNHPQGSITEAALTAGFSDHAHLTRTCRRMFGQPPSIIPR